jgi:hypothetical protein
MARLNPIRLVNGRGFVFSEYVFATVFFVGVIADNGGREELRHSSGAVGSDDEFETINGDVVVDELVEYERIGERPLSLLRISCSYCVIS